MSPLFGIGVFALVGGLLAGFRSKWAPGGRLLPFTHRVFGVGS